MSESLPIVEPKNLVPNQFIARLESGDELMTSGEIARIFRVDAKTVSRWADAGRLKTVRTPGGHRRFWRSDIAALLEVES